MKQKSVAELLTHIEFEFCKEMLTKYDDEHDCIDLYEKDEEEVKRFRKHIIKVFHLLSDKANALFKIDQKFDDIKIPKTKSYKTAKKPEKDAEEITIGYRSVQGGRGGVAHSADDLNKGGKK